MIILLADLRCLHYELKRQNDTVAVYSPFIVSSLSLNLCVDVKRTVSMKMRLFHTVAITNVLREL